jgi:hypothetical protein
MASAPVALRFCFIQKSDALMFQTQWRGELSVKEQASGR